MFEVIKSEEFLVWVTKLRDRTAALRISARIRRAELGNLGDFKFLRNCVSEMKIDVGAQVIGFISHGMATR
jgi:putative addiction module killer protein